MSKIDPGGRLPLHYAELANNVEEVEARLAAGDDPNHGDREGFTPLHFAAQEGSLEAARLYAESDRQRAGAEALAQLMRQGAGEPDAERAINLIVQRASLLLGADYCAIALYHQGVLRWEGMWGNRTDHWRQ